MKMTIASTYRTRTAESTAKKQESNRTRQKLSRRVQIQHSHRRRVQMRRRQQSTRRHQRKLRRQQRPLLQKRTWMPRQAIKMFHQMQFKNFIYKFGVLKDFLSKVTFNDISEITAQLVW